LELPFRYILTVSELTQEIKDLLELKFPDVWVEGEISNLRIPPSGHIYFTLKDNFSQIRAVLFKMQARTIKFVPKDGFHIICQGRISLYEKRGEYQLILTAMEPKGIGALQLAFLQLKERLEKEGLFDPTHKKKIPMVPQKIGIITSPTGAVIRDMLHIIHRRYENIHISLYPVRVQGEGASLEIAEGIEYFNHRMEVEVIIIGRGGGSFEDLLAFNEEVLARAVYRSHIPIISAVGHETDYTISDFVADLRAPTPSAAAELVVKEKWELRNEIDYFKNRLESQISQNLQEDRMNLSHLKKRLRDPRKRIEEQFLKVDDLVNRIDLSISWILKQKKTKYYHFIENLYLRSPIQRIKSLQLLVSQIRRGLEQNIRHFIEIYRQKEKGILGRLDSLSPLAILQRGYSITRKIPSLKILTNATHVRKGEKVEVRLYQGTLICDVERTEST
jgi:exodeoxyribonuclease VII large subunit